MSNGNLKDEYLDASNNVRHFQTVRFAQLTIFIAISGGLLSILFRRTEPLPGYGGAFIKIAGLMITALYLVLQERTMLYWRHFVNRSAELEEQLGFKQYTTRPKPGIMTGTNAMRVFFVYLMVFWIVALIWFP